jgi:hypothetical protein
MHMRLGTEPPLLVGLRFANIDSCFWWGGALLFLGAPKQKADKQASATTRPALSFSLAHVVVCM